MQQKRRIVLSLLAFGTLFVISCHTQKKATPEAACATPAPSYSANVKGIIESKCAIEGCHARGKGDFRVFENFKREADAGEIKEMVITKKAMPPNGPLSTTELQLINCWLKDGAKQN